VAARIFERGVPRLARSFSVRRGPPAAAVGQFFARRHCQRRHAHRAVGSAIVLPPAWRRPQVRGGGGGGGGEGGGGGSPATGPARPPRGPPPSLAPAPPPHPPPPRPPAPAPPTPPPAPLPPQRGPKLFFPRSSRGSAVPTSPSRIRRGLFCCPLQGGELLHLGDIALFFPPPRTRQHLPPASVTRIGPGPQLVGLRFSTRLGPP